MDFAKFTSGAKLQKNSSGRGSARPPANAKSWPGTTGGLANVSHPQGQGPKVGAASVANKIAKPGTARSAPAGAMAR